MREAESSSSTAASVRFSIPGSYALAHRLIHTFMAQEQPATGDARHWRQARIQTCHCIMTFDAVPVI